MNFKPIEQYFQKTDFINNEEREKNIDLNNLSSYEISKYMYENTRGINTPESFLIVLDSRVISSNSVGNNFVYNKVIFDLCDPIIIDSPTDIYLEFLHFQNTDISDSSGTEITPHLELTSQFYLDIDEFSIKNISNNQFQSSKFLIPNDVYGKTDRNQNDDVTNVNTSYLRLKSNYLCRIEANYLAKLTLTIQAESANGADGSDNTTFGYLSNTTVSGTTFTSITDQASLIAWATDENSIGQLGADITLVGGTWPLALDDNKILDGNGYTIAIHSGMVDGMFVLNTDGHTVTVKNLIIDANNITTMTRNEGILLSTGGDTGSDNLTINVTNVGFIGSFECGIGGGTVFGKFDENTGCNVSITNCFSEGTSGNGAGGIIGAFSCNGNGSVKIHNCFTTGIIALNGGGIAGNEFGRDHSSNGDAIITNCYSTGNMTGSGGGGIIAGNGGGNSDETSRILIGNCYSFGTVNNGAGGLCGTNAYLDKIKIENCHSVHATGDGPGNNKLIDTPRTGTGSAIINDSSSGSGTWTPNLETILLDNYTDSYGVLTDTNVWITTGDFENGYGLTVFSNSPWNGYTSHTSIPTMTKGFNSYSESSDGTGAVKIGLYFKKTKQNSKENLKQNSKENSKQNLKQKN